MKREQNQVGRPALLRHTNARTILHLLREAGSCSRADLVRASGLSAPTVTKVVADLIEANLIRPIGEGESSGGRPPSMLAFKADRGCILGVQVTASSLRFLLADLSGQALEQSELLLAHHKTTPEAICQRIGEEARQLLTRHKKARKQLLALVVAVPAIANVREGTVVSISTLDKWRSVPLRSLLSRVVDCLVIVENDTNLAAAGEHFKGAAHNEDDYVLIHIANNVSAGILLNGHIHHGAQWSAGEIGYLRLPSIAGKPPSLHEFGDLEQILSPAGIVQSWQEQARRATDPRHDAITATEIFDLASTRNARAEAILHHRAQIVADILVNLSLILNPALILLSGEIGMHPALLSSVQTYLDRCEFAVSRIAAASLGQDAALWGAVSIGLEAIPSVLLPHPES
ncbi:MAG TPA: ROK family transcriptional regulator [Acidobacteriaceae bacterium]